MVKVTVGSFAELILLHAHGHTCGGLRPELREQQAPREAQQRMVPVVRRAVALQLAGQTRVRDQPACGARHSLVSPC